MSLKGLARETLEWLDEGCYPGPDGEDVPIGAAVQAAIVGTRTWTAAQLTALREDATPGETEVLVEDATTQVAARRLAPDVALLNFASARNPGGGFLNGARAQEEDLCRCSGLFPCLTPQFEAYYGVNRRHPDNLYTDRMITSPAVPFFKTRGQDAPLAQPFLADVITAPAPNKGASPHVSEARIAEVFERRWANVLAVGRELGRGTLLLGAWGCGAFGNDPEVAACTFVEALPRYAGAFDRIVFAIPDTGRRSAANYAVFRRVLTDLS